MFLTFVLMEENGKEIELITETLELFMKYGIKSLTMDDISRHLGISKKTLYNYVSDKKELVKKTVELAINGEQCVLHALIGGQLNAIDELLEISENVSQRLQSIQPSVLFDLQKYYPESWKMMENHKECFIHDMVKENIYKGQKEGLYRDNVNAEIISSIYVTMIDKIFDSNMFPTNKYTFESIHREIVRYHLRGITNKKGRDYLVEKLNNKNHDF